MKKVLLGEYDNNYSLKILINNTSVKSVMIAPQELKQPLQPGVLPTNYKDA